MRLFLAATLATTLMAAAMGQASAACSCLCVNGRVEARCTAKTEILPVCPPTTCRSVTPSARPAPISGVPYAPAEITTTVPPSITNPESTSPAPYPPSSVAPRARIEAPVEPIPAGRATRYTGPDDHHNFHRTAIDHAPRYSDYDNPAEWLVPLLSAPSLQSEYL